MNVRLKVVWAVVWDALPLFLLGLLAKEVRLAEEPEGVPFVGADDDHSKRRVSFQQGNQSDVFPSFFFSFLPSFFLLGIPTMESLPLELFCLVASFLSPFDLLRVSLVSRSLRAQARTVAAWESCLASHRPSAPLFYLESLKVLNTDTVVMAAMKADPKGVSSVGEDLFEVAQKLKPKNPTLVDSLARLVFGVPPLFAVKDYWNWTQDFDCEEIYQVEEKSDRVEEDHDEDEDVEDNEVW